MGSCCGRNYDPFVAIDSPYSLWSLFMYQVCGKIKMRYNKIKYNNFALEPHKKNKKKYNNFALEPDEIQ
jgi:hypothetical protein